MKSDDKRTEKRQRGDIRKFVVEENKEEIERKLEKKLEDTKRQVQREILEKIEGLGHQLHRTSITDSGDCSTSPATPLQHSSLMHTERSVHKMLKPPTYDGQSSWSMYHRQFEAAAKANGWTPQEMATSLDISLRGQVLEILQSIPEEQQNDYNRIVEALEIRYGYKYLRQVYQSQIKSRQQKTNQSLQEYEADIERLVHLAYPQAPKEFLEQIGIQTFIDGLLDTEMQQALRLGRHTTISDALIAALEFKAVKEAVQHDERFGDRKKQEQVYLHGRHEPAEEGVLPVLSSSNEQLMTTTVQVEDEWSSEEMMKSQKKDNDLRLNRIPFVFAMAYCVGSGTVPMEYPQSTSWSCLKQESTKCTAAQPEDISEDVEEWCKRCDVCSAKKGPKTRIRRKMVQYLSGAPFERVAVDILGPLSVTDRGNKYLMVLPTDLMLGRPLEENQERSLPEFVGDLRERMDRIHRLAREKLKIHNDKMKQRLDTTSTETAFKPGDAVWLYAPKRTKGKSPKLQSNWEGPYTIIKKINNPIYHIQLSPRSKPKVAHLERLAKYTGHDPPRWFFVEDPPPSTEDSVIRNE
ncbi:hypothetical protein NQ318_011284 [Aromia moschata]|uniref:Tf2-1-like SH3-like domain-containing protein n=1 Tax=Aromia moschata TaxID=1265417 RepID=A0AAV8X3F4_9CUCU|nr:hypothetical protein NQ318_011284 [Aromia moschata]